MKVRRNDEGRGQRGRWAFFSDLLGGSNSIAMESQGDLIFLRSCQWQYPFL